MADKLKPAIGDRLFGIFRKSNAVMRIDVDEFEAARRDPEFRSFAREATAYRARLQQQGKSA